MRSNLKHQQDIHISFIQGDLRSNQISSAARLLKRTSQLCLLQLRHTRKDSISINIPSSSGILEKTQSFSVFNDSTFQRPQYTPAYSKGYIKIISKSSQYSQISKCIKSRRNRIEKQAFLRRSVGVCLSVWLAG
jgi:hypothetical protein